MPERRIRRIKTLGELIQNIESAENFKKRTELLFNKNKFLFWLDCYWDEIPEIKELKLKLPLINRKGRSCNIVALWDESTPIVEFIDNLKPIDDVVKQLNNYRNAFTVREEWAKYVSKVYSKT